MLNLHIAEHFVRLIFLVFDWMFKTDHRLQKKGFFHELLFQIKPWRSVGPPIIQAQ